MKHLKKLVCNKCNALYAVDDSKIAGRAVRILCKRCGHVIAAGTLHTPVAHQPPPASVTTPAVVRHRAAHSTYSQLEELAWHYSIYGKTFGPFGEDDLIAKFLSGQLGDETFVWNSAMEDWRPAVEVPVFAPALAEGKRRNPQVPPSAVKAPTPPPQQPAQIPAYQAVEPTPQPLVGATPATSVAVETEPQVVAAPPVEVEQAPGPINAAEPAHPAEESPDEHPVEKPRESRVATPSEQPTTTAARKNGEVSGQPGQWTSSSTARTSWRRRWK